MKTLLSLLNGLMGVLDKMFGNQQRAEDQASGVRKVELKKRDKQDEIRKDADEEWARPKRSRILSRHRRRRNK